ncbi:MAG: response regulator [Coriobacteriia bacterium]|nr:response regulator [Coriobacteriia bacterium]
MENNHFSILVVDDSEVLRRLAAVTLTSLGNYEVDQACDAAEALECLIDKDYDVIITDYYMPGMDGIEFIRRVRRRSGCERLPILMVTTERDPFIEEEARAAGADEFLTKPFEPLVIRETLDRVLQAAKAPAMSLRIDAQSLLDSLPYAAMVLDRHHNVILGNGVFWRSAGGGIDDAGVNCARAMHEAQTAPANCPLDSAVSSGGPAEEVVAEAGALYRVSVFPMALSDDEGQALYLHLTQPI